MGIDAPPGESALWPASDDEALEADEVTEAVRAESVAGRGMRAFTRRPPGPPATPELMAALAPAREAPLRFEAALQFGQNQLPFGFAFRPTQPKWNHSRSHFVSDKEINQCKLSIKIMPFH